MQLIKNTNRPKYGIPIAVPKNMRPLKKDTVTAIVPIEDKKIDIPVEVQIVTPISVEPTKFTEIPYYDDRKKPTELITNIEQNPIEAQPITPISEPEKIEIIPIKETIMKLPDNPPELTDPFVELPKVEKKIKRFKYSKK